MSLRRQLQRRSASLLRDGGLLRILRSELEYELSNASPFSQIRASVGEFLVDWDDPRTQDVVLHRQRGGGGSEEEIAVSALLAPLRIRDDVFLPRHALMKVCVKKLGADPVLGFDCRIEGGDDDDPPCDPPCDFAVRRVYCYPSLSARGEVDHRVPRFGCLDPELQKALKEYLLDRGINLELSNFLLQHLRKKENAQYINWLQNLERFVANGA